MKENELLRTGHRIACVTQSLSDLGLKAGADGQLVRLDGSRIRRNPAFRDWQYRLKSGERLPRGRFFRGKKPGRPVTFADEFHRFSPYFLSREGLQKIRGY